MRKMLTATVIIAASVSLGACSKKAPQNLPIAPAGPSQGVQVSPSTAIVPGSQADFRAQMAGKDAIFFDTDRFNIDDIDAAALRSQAQWLARHPQKRAIIEGHADERGTRDYNLALGERRANSAKNYLTSLGVDASRLTVVSYGKERPVARGSDEASWAQNRRAVTVTIDTGQM